MAKKPKVSILIFCNDPKKYRLVMRQISQEGWSISSVGNVKKGLQLMITKKPTHIFLSVNFKGGSILKIARLLTTTFNVPVIFFPEEFDFRTTQALKNLKWPQVMQNSISGPSIKTKIKALFQEQGLDVDGTDLNKESIKKQKKKLKKQKKKSAVATSLEEEALDYGETKKKKYGVGIEDDDYDIDSIKIKKYGLNSNEDYDDAEEDEEEFYDDSSELDIGDELFDDSTEIEEDEAAATAAKKKKKKKKKKVAGAIGADAKTASADEDYDEYEDDEDDEFEETAASSSHGASAAAHRAPEFKVEEGVGKDLEYEEEEDDDDESGEESLADILKAAQAAAASGESLVDDEDSFEAEEVDEDDEDEYEDDEELDEDEEWEEETDEDDTASSESSEDGFGDLDGERLAGGFSKKKRKQKKKQKSDGSNDLIEDEEESSDDLLSDAFIDENPEELAANRHLTELNDDVEMNIEPEKKKIAEKPELRLVPSEDNSIDMGFSFEELEKIVDDSLKQIAKPIGKLENKVEQSTELIGILVDGQISGMIVLAIGKDNAVNSGMIGSFKKALSQHKRIKQANIFFHRPVIIATESFDSKTWIEKVSDITFQVQHEKDEVVFGFVSAENVVPSLKNSPDVKMLAIDLEEVSTILPVNFDLFIYLPQNQKYIRYIASGRTLSADQRNRLLEKSIDTLHLNKSDILKLKDYFVKLFVNNKIAS